MIVVDTNVIGCLYLSSEKSPLAERALQKDGQWAAPILWRSELRNVLTLYLREKLLTLRQTQEMMSAALLLMRGREYEVSSYDVLALASESRCSAYDCEFVAVAKELAVPFVTADRQLLRSFPSVAVSLDAFVE